MWKLFLAIGFGMLLSTPSLAANVYMCKTYKVKSTGHKVKQCVVTLEEGLVGQKVDVLDDKAHVIAHGRIVKRKGSYGVVRIAKSRDHIRKGYPVLVRFENDQNSFQWAASFSNHD